MGLQTLEELNVRPGDVVKWMDKRWPEDWWVVKEGRNLDSFLAGDRCYYGDLWETARLWTIHSRNLDLKQPLEDFL